VKHPPERIEVGNLARGQCIRAGNYWRKLGRGC
jgi:hypothetical protein